MKIRYTVDMEEMIEETRPVQYTSVDLQAEKPFYYPNNIQIPANQLGQDKWQEMLRLTQADNAERGIIISSKKNDVSVSDIFAGTADVVDAHGRTIQPAGLRAPWKHELKDKIAIVHTHPMRSVISHLATTPFSVEDVRLHIFGKQVVTARIDKGGVLLMIGKSLTASHSSEEIERRIEQLVPKKNTFSDKTSFDIIHGTAEILYQSGIYTYYSPSMDAQNGFLLLDNALGVHRNTVNPQQ